MCSREERESRALTVWKEEGEEEGYSSKKMENWWIFSLEMSVQ